MTMEMWQLGLHMERLRLAFLLLLAFPLLVGLAYYLGFEDSTDLVDAAIDACVAFAVAAFLAMLVLYAFGVLRAGMSLDDWIGKVGLQSITGSIGALLAQSQFGRTRKESPRHRRRRGGDFAQYFFMAAGALFLSANVAPTEEVVLIAYMTTPWHTIVLALLSLIVMHAFVYALEFKGQRQPAEGVTFGREFMRFTLIGYLMALAISAYFCWCFGRFDGLSPDLALRTSVVLAFPTAVGAAAARLVL